MTEEYKEINAKRLEMLERAYRVCLWVHHSDELGTWDELRTSVAPDLAEFRKAQQVCFDDYKTSLADVLRDNSETVSECCGSVGDEDVGICPVCLEHCEFVDPMSEVPVPHDGKYTLDEVMDWDKGGER